MRYYTAKHLVLCLLGSCVAFLLMSYHLFVIFLALVASQSLHPSPCPSRIPVLALVASQSLHQWHPSSCPSRIPILALVKIHSSSGPITCVPPHLAVIVLCYQLYRKACLPFSHLLGKVQQRRYETDAEKIDKICDVSLLNIHAGQQLSANDL